MLAPTRTATDAEKQKAAALMGKARSLLLLDAPFFGSLALRLRVTELPGQGLLMATDGTHLFYDPLEVLAIPERSAITVIAHEVLHCALGHVWREGGRDHDRWNVACDHVVNLQLDGAGFTFPPSGPWQGLKDPKYKDLSAEEVYNLLPKEKGDGPGPVGPGTGGGGGKRPVPPGYRPDMVPPQPGAGDKNDGQDKGPQDGPMTEGDWQIAAEQAAMVAQKAGKLPAGLARLIREARQPRVDWRAVLREFVENTVPSDYSWSQPNRRHVAAGLYLPGVFKENTARGVVVVDTSGSVSQPMLDQMAGELTSILQDARPESLTVLYCDAAVQGEPAEFTPDDGEVELELRGGGGTMFKPAFDRVERLFDGEPPAFLIYLTDMFSGDINSLRDPGYPTLWAIVSNFSVDDVPFGRGVRVDIEV